MDTTVKSPDRFHTDASPDDVREVVREKYGAIALSGGQSSCCGGTSSCGCASAPDGDQVLAAIGYGPDVSAAIPEGANLGLGCGNPLAYAAVKPGETVLDLGSGAGIDVFLAARETGPTGRVIGVDMTAAMIAKARDNARRVGATNVEFRLGEIEHLPLADASVDVVISNCVINLSPEKPQVFREVLRVLKPGGRMLVSDLVLTRPLEPELQRSIDCYVGCVAGASQKQEYLDLVTGAGFTEVAVVGESLYAVGLETIPAGDRDRVPYDAVASVKVRAVKPSA
jgi:SAM-dependent methyltransferase